MHSAKSAPVHDLLYRFQDFAREARSVIDIIERYNPGAQTVLDVACGPHEHARTLIGKYRVDGIDILPEFLDTARQKNPRGRYWAADMRDFRLEDAYDAVLCLSSSIGYLGDTDELDSVIANFARHLNAGGVAILVPWYTPHNWKDKPLSLVTVDEPDLKVVRITRRSRDGSMSFMDFTYVVATGAEVDVFEERHALALFSDADIQRAFAKAGMACEHIAADTGWGYWVGWNTTPEPRGPGL